MSAYFQRNLVGCSDAIESYCNVHALNDNQLLLVPDSRGTSLWKFNLTSKEFIKWYEYPEHYRFMYCTSSLNHNSTKLYIFGDAGRIITVDLNIGKFSMSPTRYHDGSGSKSRFINGQFHIFGGWRPENKSHYIWNEEKQFLIEAHKFDEMDDVEELNGFAMVYIKSKHLIFLMDNISSKAVYAYNMISNTCIKTDIDRNGINFCEAIVTHDEQFMIAFESGYKKDSGSIGVMDLNTMRFRERKLLLPADSRIGRVCVKNSEPMAQCLSYGYIRQHRKELHFPMDIIDLISQFLIMETIFMTNSKNIWSMDVIEIIQRSTD